MKTNATHDLADLAAARKTSGAADVKYTVAPNAMPSTQEDAPYLGHIRVAGSCSQDELADDVVKGGCLMNREEIVRVWNGFGAYLLGRMPEAPRVFDLGFMRAWPVIGGTFPSSDAEFDPERNELYVAVAPSAEIRAALDGGTPTSADAAPDSSSVRNVQWKEGHEANTIRSGAPFWILGQNLTIGTGDERAELKLPGDGGTVEVSLEAQTGDDGSQRIVGTLAHAVDACEGAVLTLWTHGSSPESSPFPVSSHKLTVLAGGGPVPIAQTSDGKCRIMSFKDGDSAAEFTLGHPWRIEGAGLYDIGAPSGEWEFDGASATVDGVEVDFSIAFGGDGTYGTFGEHGGELSAGVYENVALRYTVTRDGETETLTLAIPRLVVE